jgi:hypothetical protein
MTRLQLIFYNAVLPLLLGVCLGIIAQHAGVIFK